MLLHHASRQQTSRQLVTIPANQVFIAYRREHQLSNSTQHAGHGLVKDSCKNTFRPCTAHDHNHQTQCQNMQTQTIFPIRTCHSLSTYLFISFSTCSLPPRLQSSQHKLKFAVCLPAPHSFPSQPTLGNPSLSTSAPSLPLFPLGSTCCHLETKNRS